MKKKEILRFLFKAYLIYSITADIIVLTGIFYLILNLGG